MMPKRSEADIKRAIIQYLNMRRCLVIPYRTTGIKTDHGWIRAVKKGISDILGLTRQGEFFAIEVKAQSGRTTPEQDQFLAAVRQYGCKAFIARSVEDVQKEGL
jgi:hypothetical protein